MDDYEVAAFDMRGYGQSEVPQVSVYPCRTLLFSCRQHPSVRYTYWLPRKASGLSVVWHVLEAYIRAEVLVRRVSHFRQRSMTYAS